MLLVCSFNQSLWRYGRRGFGGGGGGGGDGIEGWGGSPLFHVFCMPSPFCLSPCPAISSPASL